MEEYMEEYTMEQIEEFLAWDKEVEKLEDWVYEEVDK